MTHPHDFALLNDLLDGRLAAAAAEEMRERIAEEPDLQAAWNDLRRMRAGVRSLPAPVVPSDFAARVRLRAGIPADAAESTAAGGGGVVRPIDGSANHAPQGVAGGGHSTISTGEGGRLLGLPRRFFAIAASVGIALGAGTWIVLERSGYAPETHTNSRQSAADRHRPDQEKGDRLERPSPEDSDKTLLALEDARRKQRESGAGDAQAPESDLKDAAPAEQGAPGAPRGRFVAPGGAVPPALREPTEAPTEAPSAPGAKPSSTANTPGEPAKPGEPAMPGDSARSAEPKGGGGAGRGGVPPAPAGHAPTGGTSLGAPSPTGGSAPATPPPRVPSPVAGPLPRESDSEAAMAEGLVPVRRAGAATEKAASGEADEDAAKAKDAGGAFGEREKAKKAPGAPEGFVGGRDDEKAWKARSADHEAVLVLRAANLDVARAQVALLVAALRAPGSPAPDVAGFSRAASTAPTATSRATPQEHDADEVDPTATRESEAASLGVLVVDLTPSAFSRLESALATGESAEEVDRATKLEQSKAQAKSAPAKSDKAPEPTLPAGPPRPSFSAPMPPVAPPPPAPSASPPTTPSTPSAPLPHPTPAPAPMPAAPVLPSGRESPPLAEPGSVGGTPAGSTASGGAPGDGKARGADLQGATRAEKGREGDGARAMRRVRIVVLPP